MAPLRSTEPAKRSSPKTRTSLLLLAALSLGISSRALADPVSVSFTTSQSTGSEWTYNYAVTGSFATQDDLAIYFPLASSASLADLKTGGSDWTTFILQPDPSLPSDGEFDLVASKSNPDLTPIFSVSFLYSGAGSPGAQAFTLFDSSFTPLANGSTQPGGSPGMPTPPPPPTSSVPEPSSFLLVGSGLLTLWKASRRTP